jgi:hypothetical protein
VRRYAELNGQTLVALTGAATMPKELTELEFVWGDACRPPAIPPGAFVLLYDTAGMTMQHAATLLDRVHDAGASLQVFEP